ncbi:hypothetical protein SDC9_121949 [bioreactor metagenome]|uniref:DUF6873 domain-containing protein n=1 Tax=bioreactor metagenome TaxID=1076179 RepID=A0A645CDG2_9ZZZZ
MKFLENPFLPKRDVSHVVVGAQYFHILRDPLHDLKITPIKSPVFKQTDARVSSHPDMMMFVCKNKVFCAPEIKKELHTSLSSYGFELLAGEKETAINYPENIRFNCLPIGSFFFHKLNHTDPKILYDVKFLSLQLIDVAQGYTKCSVAPIADKALITADQKIAGICEKLGFDVLLIREGFIDLEGYPYGFIGGCCGMIGQNKICFSGRLDHHTDYEKIMLFLDKHKVKPYWLTQQKAFDVGSIIPILEYD